MISNILILYDQEEAFLKIQAMQQALFLNTKIPVTSIRIPEISFGALGSQIQNSWCLLVDPPLTDQMAELQQKYEMKCFFSAATRSREKKIVSWVTHIKEHKFFEKIPVDLAGVETVKQLIIPPIYINDTDPKNPLRHRDNHAVCIPTPPVQSKHARHLLKTYLMEDANFSLSFLQPAESMDELSERLQHFSCFFVPEYNPPMWSFELSCFLCSGGLVAGIVPEILCAYCYPCKDLNGIEKGFAHPINTHGPLRSTMEKHFVENLLS